MLKKHRWMPGMSSSVRWGWFWVGVSGHGHSRAISWAAIMYGQSCREVGRGVVGPMRFGGASLAIGGDFPLLGAKCELRHPPLRGDLQGPLGPFSKAIHGVANVLVASVDGEQRVQEPALPRAPDVGVVRLVLPGVRVRALVVRGGGGGA